MNGSWQNTDFEYTILDKSIFQVFNFVKSSLACHLICIYLSPVDTKEWHSFQDKTIWAWKRHAQLNLTYFFRIYYNRWVFKNIYLIFFLLSPKITWNKSDKENKIKPLPDNTTFWAGQLEELVKSGTWFKLRDWRELRDVPWNQQAKSTQSIKLL